MSKKRVVIVGGGAAGFFCAANLNPDQYEISIFEQNSDVLQKVKISGGGRCNVTHACFDPRELVQFYPRGTKELLSVFTKFQPGDTMAWFSDRGVELKIENDNRVFPITDSSQTIINTLVKASEQNHVDVKTKTSVKDILITESTYEIHTNQGVFTADILVYTTGSSPKSLQLIEKLGHKIVSPVPSLFTFNIKDELLKDLPGTSFSNATVSIPELKSEESGPLLITHWGLSGPAILKISAWEARTLAAKKYNFSIRVNFIDLDKEDARMKIMEFKEQNPKKTLGQSKIFDITNRFWNRILEISKIKPEMQISQLNAQSISLLVENLCARPFQVTGKSTFKDEFVTAGGVHLKEIDFKTMRSKVLPNLYLAGEVLNIDAVTGGFNFQACWSEAYLIAQDLNQL